MPKAIIRGNLEIVVGDPVSCGGKALMQRDA